MSGSAVSAVSGAGSEAILLKGGLVLDPASQTEQVMDVRIAGGVIQKMGVGLDAAGARIVDVSGKIVAPGLIDLHVHLREPGGEVHETIRTGSMAAAAGGFTTICAMPNTSPRGDDPTVMEYILREGAGCGLTEVLPIGTISKKSEGKEISEIGLLCQAGACAISDDGNPVVSGLVLRRALEYAGPFGIPVIDHCEDPGLKDEGLMHEGYWSTRLGLKGIPAESEAVAVARDILLAGLTRGKMHLAHISARQSVELLRFAAECGIPVTAEATPHHLALTDAEVQGYDTSFKVSPPLRGEDHRRAVLEAVKSGLITCIATDHAPWDQEHKDCEFENASNGIVGMETALAVVWDTLVVREGMRPMDLIARMTLGPAEVLGRKDRGRLAEGGRADLVVVDPELSRRVDRETLYSKGKNCPYHGRTYQGWPVLTVANGRITMEDGKVTAEG
jgi:dihydroorotase